MNRSQVAGKVKGQICEFSGKLCQGLPKVVGRFVGEALYGILSKQSVDVAEVARSLDEPIRLIKTENRLCRQLGRRGLGESFTNRVIEEGVFDVHKDTLFIIDSSDVTKKYAKKMQDLAEVRDGSEKTIGHGY